MPPFSFYRVFFLLLAAFPALNATRADIIISQYYEGNNLVNKYIELYNTGNSAVDLGAGDYRIGSWLNNVKREAWKTDGAPTSSAPLTGTIAAHSTFVIAHSTATTLNGPGNDVLGSAFTSTGNAINVSGDDTIILFTGSTYAFANVKDVLGVTLAMVTTYGTTYLSDKSLVRNASITTGVNTDYNPADWTEYTLEQVNTATPGTTEYLGFHVVAAPEPATAGLLGLGLLVIRFFRRR